MLDIRAILTENTC